MGNALASALIMDRGVEDNKCGRKNGGGDGKGHGKGSQGVQEKGQSQVQGGKGQGQGHWDQGYQIGKGATENASMEARLLAERLICGEGLVSSRQQRILTISYDRPCREGGALYQWWRQRRKEKLVQIVIK